MGSEEVSYMNRDTKLRDEEITLVKLGNSNIFLHEPLRGSCGCTVRDRSGNDVGTVETLYIDEVGQKIRFLGLSAEGSSGLGTKRFLIPRELVDAVTQDLVIIDKGWEKIVGAPEFDVNLVPGYSHQCAVYQFYGVTSAPN